MNTEKIGDGVFRINGAVNAGVIIRDGCALLIDAPETEAAGDLIETVHRCGAEKIEIILLTQYRRAFCGGLPELNDGRPKVWASAEEAALLENAEALWASAGNRYHRFLRLPNPDKFLPLENIPVDRIIKDGEKLEWRGVVITALKFSAVSDGDMCYVVDTGGEKIAFCGALVMAGGQIHDLLALQKSAEGISGFHGFMGGFRAWCGGMERLLALEPDMLAPAYGAAEKNPRSAVTGLKEQLEEYCVEFSSYSALDYYFGKDFRRLFAGLRRDVDWAERVDCPPFLKHMADAPSFLLKSDSGDAILIDCGEDKVADIVTGMINGGEITGLNMCWVTHYHMDHVESTGYLTSLKDCRICTTVSVAEVANQPMAYFLPGASDVNARCEVIEDKKQWKWHEFTLTSLIFPGQTLYHSALFVEGKGCSVLFCGDSFSPSGLDDYNGDDRNLCGENRGYRYCLGVIEKLKPDYIINSHQDQAFVYDEKYIKELTGTLDRRRKILEEILPNGEKIGMDNLWLRVWPFEQIIHSGNKLIFEVHITSNGEHMIKVAPILPEGWQSVLPREICTHNLSSGSVFWTVGGLEKDSELRFGVDVPEDAKGLYRIPFQVWLDGKFIGSFAHTEVHIL